jgi:hypothetical protein
MGSETDNIANKAKKFPSFDGIVNLKASDKPLRVYSKVVIALDCIPKVPSSSRNIDYLT